MNRSIPTTARPGFTLIEVLVVIAIIAILAALLLGGVMVFMGKGPEMKTKTEMSQLAVQIEKFKAKKGIYPPSQIVLRTRLMDYNQAIPQEAMSANVIATLWPNLPSSAVVQWVPGMGAGTSYVLDPDQCLVFFLGGPPNPAGGLLGFSTDPTNPVNPNTDREKWFDFEVGRLVQRDATKPFYSYNDGWRQAPYMYFSSGGKRDNGYVFFASASIPITNGPYVQQTAPTVRYYNSSSFQLISAGPDGQFGLGGAWTPGNTTPQGRDDVSNFHDKALGNP